jgi:hypothetical protein
MRVQNVRSPLCIAKMSPSNINGHRGVAALLQIEGDQ